jgi:tol-pal system protein YbgF
LLKRAEIFALCGVLLAAALGCAALETDIPALESNVNAHTASINRLRAQVDELQGRLDALAARHRQLTQKEPAQARLVAQLDQLDARLNELAGRIEENRHFLGEVGTRLERLTALESRLAVLEEKTAQLTALRGGPASPYEEALALLRGGQPEAARAKLTEFLKKNPDSELAPNARFWLAESYYDQQRYEEAIVEYQEVIERYPASEKAAGALLKQAMSFERLGSPDNARLLREKLIDTYPASPQAEVARKQLATAETGPGSGHRWPA